MTDPVPALMNEIDRLGADLGRALAERNVLAKELKIIEHGVDARLVVADVRLTAAKEVAHDLADVLAHMVVGWEEALGVDLAKHPEVIRVMTRYREFKELTL